jgi:hypothetical protein
VNFTLMMKYHRATAAVPRTPAHMLQVLTAQHVREERGVVLVFGEPGVRAIRGFE